MSEQQYITEDKLRHVLKILEDIALGGLKLSEDIEAIKQRLDVLEERGRKLERLTSGLSEDNVMKFPVYIACGSDVCAGDSTNVVADCGDSEEVATYLARATEVVNAIGTDDPMKALAIKMGSDAYLQLDHDAVGRALGVVNALGTDDVDQAVAMAITKDESDALSALLMALDGPGTRMTTREALERIAKMQAVVNALGTDDPEQAKVMRDDSLLYGELAVRHETLVSAVGTDDPVLISHQVATWRQKEADYTAVWEALQALRNALGTDDIEDAKVMKQTCDEYNDIIVALGTSDLDEMRRMKKVYDHVTKDCVDCEECALEIPRAGDVDGSDEDTSDE